MPTMPGHVYLVDDTPELRHHLEDLLRLLGYSVASYPDAESFLANAVEQSPAVLLLDVRMPGISGVELQKRLKSMGRLIPIVFISGESQGREIVEAFKSGAIDFLFKPFGRQELVMAIDKALSCDALRHQHSQRMARFNRMFDTLTEREREVFSMMLGAHTNKEIGALTGIQAGTVKKHRAAVLAKMQVQSASEMLREWADLWPRLLELKSGKLLNH